MADELDIDAELVEEVLQEEHLGADACHHAGSSAVAAHINLVGSRCEVVCSGSRIFEVSHHCLAAFPEIGDCLAEFLYLGDACAESFRTEVDILYRRVSCSGFDGLYCIPKSYRCGFVSLDYSHRVHFLCLLGHHHLSEVHVQDA